MADAGRLPALPWWAPYRALVASRIRSQTGYRASFAADLLASMAFALTEVVEVYLVFHNTDILGGLDRTECFLLFALSRCGFAVADLVTGQIDEVPTYLRAGTLEVFMVRPLPVLAQLVLGDVALRRLGRLGLYLVVLTVALVTADVDWTPARVLLVPLTVAGGAVIFSSVFVAAGALQFRLLDGGEVVNSMTYGGGYVGSFSGELLPAPLRAVFTAVVPALFTGYLPTLTLLDRPGAGFPAWTGWLVAPVGLLTACAAAALWRNGVRHYQGGGG